MDDAYAIVKSSTADARYFTYASVIDNRSGDPVCVPAQVLGTSATAKIESALDSDDKALLIGGCRGRGFPLSFLDPPVARTVGALRTW